MEFFEFDEEYLKRLRDGDAATVRHFVAYFDRLLRILLRAKMLPPDKVEDLTQETFKRVLVALHQEGGIRQPKSFGSFVNSTCRYALFERERVGKKLDPLDDEHAEIADQLEDAHAALEKQELRVEVRGTLASLPDKDRELLRDLFFLDKDKDEICREKGVDREYLRVLVHRAKSRFRSEYEDKRAKRGMSKE